MRLKIACAFIGLILPAAAFADDKIVKIGSLSDQTGLYADVTGPGSFLAAQMAVEDSGLLKKGWTIDVISGDHQNKPDIGSGIARKWFDEDKVDVIVDVPNSGVGLAVAQVVKEKNGVFLNSGGASSDLTGKACTPNLVHWTYDTYALANGTGKAVVKAGGDSWFFLTADYAFGHALQRDTTAVIEANGGKVLGSVNVPLNTPDFSSFLLQAQSSKPRSSGSPTPAAIRRTPSNKPMNSASSPAANGSRRCCCLSRMSMRSVSKWRRACSSPRPFIGT